jgi:hypothetical protein
MSVDVSAISTSISGLTISSPRDGWYRRRMIRLLLPIRIHQHTQSNARARAASIKLKNSFKRLHLVDLVQVYSLTSLSIESNPLLMAVPCMVMSVLWSFSSPMHFSSCWKDDNLVYCWYPWYQCLVTSKTKDRRIYLSFFFVIRPTRCTNLFWYETRHVSDSSSVHRQEFIHCTLSNGISPTGLETAFEQDQDGTAVPSWSCQNKLVKLVHLVGLVTKIFVTMHGHMNVKDLSLFYTEK